MSLQNLPGIKTLALILLMVAGGICGAIFPADSGFATHCDGILCTEDIANTKHNLAANDDIQATGTTEVCVFCHTPHGANNQEQGDAPLWNRALPPGDQFTVYDSPNFDALGQTPGTPKGVSLACLSCHDGVIALDALINAPGSGGFQSANRGILTGDQPGADVSNIDFSGPGVDGTFSMSEGDRPDTQDTGDPDQGFHGGLDDFVNPDGGGMEPFPNLSRNLGDDHPISMEMPETDPQFQEALNNLEAPPGASTNIMGVKRGEDYSMPSDKRDWVRLYNTVGEEAKYVECASCHNPHSPRTTFLRLPSVPGQAVAGSEIIVDGGARDLNHEPNQGSLICLTCHQK